MRAAPVPLTPPTGTVEAADRPPAGRHGGSHGSTSGHSEYSEYPEYSEATSYSEYSEATSRAVSRNMPSVGLRLLAPCTTVTSSDR